MADKRKNYTKEFKEQAIKMVLEQGLNKSEVGRKLGVHSTSIENWIRAYNSEARMHFQARAISNPRTKRFVSSKRKSASFAWKGTF